VFIDNELPRNVHNTQQVEDDILDCIRVVHPGLQLSQSALRSQFINPATKTVEDPVTDIENGILAAYLPNEADEPEAECTVPPPVTPYEALAHIEGLLLFSLQAEPTANINELQEVLKREKKRIETLEIQRRVQHIQRRITDFLGLAETASSSSASAP